MRIAVVLNRDISEFPPVVNLVLNLLNNGHLVTVVTKDQNGVLKSIKNKNLKYKLLVPYENENILNKAKIMMNNRRFLRYYVDKIMKYNDIIWTTTDATVREVGPILLKYKHVMQLMELIEYLPLIPQKHILKYDIKKYARSAWKVVVPEINRAYIQKVWWGLKKTPVVLPNKPYDISIDDIPDELLPYIKKMESEKRRILLYQGVFYEDRNLEAYAKAVMKLQDTYAFYIMGGDNEYRRYLCDEYKHIVYVPFVSPPGHLVITEKADIGILPYVAKRVKNSNNSVLNPLYCAPNKIYEYAAFGLPMIGSDVLGLKSPFEKYDIGVTCKGNDVKEIIGKLKYIDDNYDKMSNNCKDFYNEIDLDKIVHDILYEKP